MKGIFCLLVLLLAGAALHAQYVYTINADSVKITNHCDTAELILENHTQNVPGFLFNKGRGRTEFRKVFQKLNDSLYLVGTDTLKVFPHPWLQGGNAFDTTGVFGTRDNQHLDFYTHDSLRGRLTNTGHWLIGTTADNGSNFQVGGNSYFNGNVGIGSATITNTGNLIGTNAILFNRVISQYHNYQGNDPYISQLCNVLYNYAGRFNTTSTTGADGSINIDIVIPEHEIQPGYHGIVYPGGFMCFSFWNNGVPQSVSVAMKNYQDVWYGPFTANTNTGNGGAGFFQVPIPGAFNFVTEIKITIVPSSGGFINLQNVEYMLESGPQGLINGLPYVSKFGDERLYNFLSFKYAGQDNVRISPYPTYPSYFLNDIGIGTASPSAQLHTTGTVRFAGLSNDATKTRVLVSDENGNLFYRNLSSWSSGGIVNKDLAVKGTLSARQLKLMPAGWADYVFDKTYRLPSLPELETYIKHNNHLPGIPAAAEVKQNGIEVGETQAALLKKIEELTLYVIDQEKKSRQQSEELAFLKQEMAELRKLVGNNNTGNPTPIK